MLFSSAMHNQARQRATNYTKHNYMVRFPFTCNASIMLIVIYRCLYVHRMSLQLHPNNLCAVYYTCICAPDCVLECHSHNLHVTVKSNGRFRICARICPQRYCRCGSAIGAAMYPHLIVKGYCGCMQREKEYLKTLGRVE